MQQQQQLTTQAPTVAVVSQQNVLRIHKQPLSVQVQPLSTQQSQQQQQIITQQPQQQ